MAHEFQRRVIRETQELYDLLENSRRPLGYYETDAEWLAERHDAMFTIGLAMEASDAAGEFQKLPTGYSEKVYVNVISTLNI